MLKFLKREFFSNDSPPLIKEIMDEVRKQDPKLYWKTVNSMSGLRKQVTIATSFKHTVDENQKIREPISFGQYLKKLYWKEGA